MKSIYAKFSLFVLLASTVTTAFGQPRAKARGEKEFRNLGEKSVPMDIETFKRHINAANLSELEFG